MKNKVFKRGLSFLLSVLMVFSLLTVIPAVSVGTDAEAASYTNSGTVTAWYTAMCDLNGEQTKEALVDKYFESDGIISFKTNSTFRSRIQLSYGGATFRVKLTNYYGDTAINVTKMNAALAGNGNATSINGNTIKNITVNGKTSFSIPKGGYVWTDWFTINLSPGDYLVLSSYVANSGKVRDAGLTGSTSYCWMGDQMTNTEWSYGALGKLVSEDPNTGNFEITPMINCVETKTGDTSAYTAVVIGDSTVTNSIPGLIQSKVNGAGLDNVSVVGAGIKGNELLADGVGGDGPLEGDALLTRFDLDALSLAGVKKVFVKIGVNDIVHPNCSNLAQYFDGTPSAQEIINAYKQLISAAHAKGIEIYFFDITPWIGYTRNGTVTTDETTMAQMEAVRLKVNQWLADNCSHYTDEDNMTVDPKSGYSFGYIPVSEAVGELRSGHSDQYVLKSAYTTDHIHYSAAGQTVIANHVPISIFKGVKAEDVEKTASVGNLYVATTSTVGGGYYFFGSSENLSSGASDQQSTMYLMQSDGSQTSDIEKAYSNPWRGAIYGNPVADADNLPATLQRGTGGAPYIAVKSTSVNEVTVPSESAYRQAYWQRKAAENTLIDWRSYSDNLAIAFYYPFWGTVSVFDTGLRNSVNYNYVDGGSSEWYSLNTVKAYDASKSYKSLVYYGSNTAGIVSGDKYLSYYNFTPKNGNGEDVKTGYAFRVLNNSTIKVDSNSNLVTLYAAAQVDTTLGITEGSKAQTYYNADNGTVVPFTYTLTDNLANSPTGSKGNVSTLTAPTDNFASYGSFVGYTYGESRSVTWESDNENVAKIENGQVVLTGNGGTANLTMTLTWKELDGTVYTMKDTATVTNIKYTADICIDSYYPETYSVDNFSGSMTKDVSVTYESNPLAELPSGGSWVWSSSDKNIFTVSGSGANATVSFTGNGGTANLTAAYVYNGRTICSDTVAITNNTAGIDIQMADDAIDTAAQAYPDLKRICGINPDDTLTLTAQPVGTGAAGMDMNGSYAWSFEGAAPEGVTLSNADARTATLTFAGTETTATVKLSYTVNGNTYESYVTVTAVPGIAASNVVIDFGLPVQIGLEGEVSGISADKPSVALDTGVTAGDEYNAAKSAKTAYGSASLNGITLTYTPEKIALEQDTVYYSAKVDKGYKYSTVDIIPAADVYYEDSFVSYEGKWTSVGEGYTGEIHGGDKNDVYGYDETYGQYTQYSLGKAKQVTVSGSETAKASFTFTGTGFEIYSACTSKQGGAVISVYNKDNQRVGMKKLVATSSNGEYWQTPVYMQNLDYGTYRVDIEVAYSGALDPANADGVRSGSVTFILDGVRIYNTSDTYNDKYAADEQNARFISVRKQLLTKDSFNEGTTVGAVFIDGWVELDSEGKPVFGEDGKLNYKEKITTKNVADYKNFGPKNEVYLAAGQAVAFRVVNYSGESLQLGMKAANLNVSAVNVNGQTIELAGSTAMYYKITSDDGMVVIVNSGGGLVSITNLKISGAGIDTAAVPRGLSVDNDVVSYAASVMMAIREEPAPSEEPQPTEEPTPTEEPEPTEDPDPAPTDEPDEGDDDDGGKTVTVWEKLINAAKRLNEAIKSFVSKLFGR